MAPRTYDTYGAVNAVPIMLETYEEGAYNLMAASCTVADRRPVPSAAEGAAGGGTIMPFRVTKALDSYRVTKRQTRPRFTCYLECICGIPTRFLNTNERS